MITLRTFGIKLMNDFDLARIKVPLNRDYVDFISNKLGWAKDRFELSDKKKWVSEGDVDSAFDSVSSALGYTRILLQSPEDFDRAELLKNVAAQIQELLPKFGERDRKFITRKLAGITKMAEELSSQPQPQQHPVPAF